MAVDLGWLYGYNIWTSGYMEGCYKPETYNLFSFSFSPDDSKQKKSKKKHKKNRTTVRGVSSGDSDGAANAEENDDTEVLPGPSGESMNKSMEVEALVRYEVSC